MFERNYTRLSVVSTAHGPLHSGQDRYTVYPSSCLATTMPNPPHFQQTRIPILSPSDSIRYHADGNPEEMLLLVGLTVPPQYVWGGTVLR